MKSRQEIERLSRQKAKKRLMLILLGLCVAFVAAAIILINVIPDQKEETAKKDPPKIIDGEALYNNYPIAYPKMEESQIKEITVTNSATGKDKYDSEDDVPKTTYRLIRYDKMDGKFVLSYDDGTGEELYYPDIIGSDLTFDYESLYSIEQNDGYSRIYKLTYLCIALELPYFTDRIPLPENEAERASMLRGFGLDDPASTITFKYVDSEKNQITRTVRIGDKNVTGLGYYFMVDDRPYIYNSMANYYDYAMLGFYSYVNSILVSAGLPEDSAYEPYLTTDYKQWANKTFDEAGTEIKDGSTVILYSDVFLPLEATLDKKQAEKEPGRFMYDGDVPEQSKDGYIKEGYSLLEIDLSNKELYSRFAKALAGKRLGAFDKEIIVTLTSNAKGIDFGEQSSIKYDYEIIEIEAIVTDGADITESAERIGDNNLIRIAYYLSISGKRVSNIPYHGVIDLSSDVFDRDKVNALRQLTLGKLSDNERITLSADYTKENAKKINLAYRIKAILGIYDKNGKKIEKVTASSQVIYRYSLVVDGVEQDYETDVVDFSKENGEIVDSIKARLLDKRIGNKYNFVAYEHTAYCERVQDFMTYKVKSADSFITSELISAFRFQNNSERDPFYGESIYENTMDNKYSFYAINSATCQEVAKMLGGIGDTTGQSEGLVGIQTVAVGLTAEVKKTYGLYAHTVYFELPRGVIVIPSGSDDIVDDYDWYKTLGFTLYISEERYDEELGGYIRYVGSDLYDVVAKVSAEKLVFLKHNFVDFWARKSLMMFDIKYLDKISVEFNMEDLAGSYIFDLTHRTGYIVQSSAGNKLVFTEPESYTDVYNYITVGVITDCKCAGECKCTETKLSQMADERDGDRVPLHSLYNKYITEGDGVAFSDGTAYIGYETAGTSYFRDVMTVLFATQYAGTLTPEEQAKALSEAPMVMRIAVTLDKEKAPTTSEYSHVYEFYRCDDRKVMVRQYNIDKNGDKVISADYSEVSDFYISSFAFKKIVADYFALLNAERIDAEIPYPEVSK